MPLSHYQNMKRASLFLSLALAAVTAGAAERSDRQLLDIAGRVLNPSSRKASAIGDNTDMKPGLAILYESNGVVVVGAKSRGFTVLSRDDDFKAVLGYSDADFDSADINPNMQWWMDCTAAAMEQGYARSASVPEGLPAEVGSFVTTHWAQDSPYNDLCPSYTSGSSTKRYPSGCVATAMSQAMNYYKYPEHGTTTRLYRFNPGTGEQVTQKVVLDDIIFDWDNMLDEYNSGSYSEAQGKAVAELMLACGASVEMEYTPSGSGAMGTQACYALRTYFGYDAGMPYYYKDGLTIREFEGVIFKTIAANKPVIFGGQSTSGGHAFVLDGYDSEGNVHVNWGWGKRGGDGYFDIATMNGFSSGQGCYPVSKDGTYAAPVSMFSIYDGALTISKVDATHIKVTTDGRLLNIACDTYKGDVYLVAQNTVSGEKSIIATEKLSGAVMALYFASSGGISKPYVTIKNKIGDGSYRLFLATKSETETDFSPVRTTDDKTNSFAMTVADGAITSLEADSDAAWMISTTGIKDVFMDADKGNGSTSYFSISGQRLSSPSSRSIVITRQGGKVRKCISK